MKRRISLFMAFCMAVALSACGTVTPPTGEKDPVSVGAEGVVLRVAMECDYAPYNWAQPTEANGAVPISGSSDYAHGYDVMMAKYIAEALGYELEIVQLDWADIIDAVQAGTVDVGICGQSITAERLETVDFTEPYYYASVVALVKTDGPYSGAKSVAELAGASCTSQVKTVWYDVCLPQIEGANVLPGQENTSDMLAALTSGLADVVVTDKPTALAAAFVDPNIKVLELERENGFVVSDEEINIGISLKKGNDALREAINGVLATLTVDDYSRMMYEATTLQPLNQ